MSKIRTKIEEIEMKNIREKIIGDSVISTSLNKKEVLEQLQLQGSIQIKAMINKYIEKYENPDTGRYRFTLEELTHT